jgi:putative aldouronate transport system substrate-binding protein
MKKSSRISSLLAVVVLSGGTLAACSKPAEPAKPGAAAPGTAPSTAGTTYPIKTDTTLQYWGEMNANLNGLKSSLNEVPFFQEWQKRTGVKLKFTQPATGQSKEAFNVMLASGELPDMVEYDWLSGFPGGPEKAINDGYILKLNDMIDKHAPNLKKYLKDHPDVDKMVKTDNGSYFVFPFIRDHEDLMVYQGTMLRKDWLDELGLPVPETMDEWYTTLKAFKEKKGSKAPLSFLSKPRAMEGIYNGAFIGAFGIHRLFYIDNNQVKFGPAQPEYKQFLATFRKWYEEGLLDKNFPGMDSKALDANITSGVSGAMIGNAGSGIGKWLPALQAKDPKADLIAAPYPVMKKGDKPKFGQKDFAFTSITGNVAISAKTKNAELAVKMLDYGYGEQGHLFFNFGTPGVSYNLENGYPKYTDLIMNNPEKLAPAQAMSLYFRGSYGGTFIQDKRYIEQYLTLKQQKDALAVWKHTDNDKYGLPPVSPTPQEATEMAKIMNDVNTLVDEASLKIILGSEPLDYFDKYVEKLKTLRIDRAVEIQNAALDRYKKR